MVRKRRTQWSALLSTLFAGLTLAPVRAQVAPEASKPAHSLRAGVEYSNFSSSFPFQSGRRLNGAGAFVDYHLDNWLYLEADASLLSFSGFEGSTESSFVGGPKAYFLARGNLRPFARLLAGVGSIYFPVAMGHASCPALAPGAGADYRLSRRWAVRIAYEYEIWLSPPASAATPGQRLAPNGLQFGFAYSVLR